MSNYLTGRIQAVYADDRHKKDAKAVREFSRIPEIVQIYQKEFE